MCIIHLIGITEKTYVKLGDVSSEAIGLYQVNGGVVTSHAIRVTSHMRDGTEYQASQCCERSSGEQHSTQGREEIAQASK